MPLKIEYISVLAQAQKAMGIGNIERYVGFVMNMAQIDPAARHKLNAMEAIDAYADATGVPPKLVNSNEQVMQATSAEQQQMQMQQMAAMAQPLADASKTVAETTAISQANGTGGMSPDQVNQMMQAMGAQ